MKKGATMYKRGIGTILILGLLFASSIICVKGIGPAPVPLGTAANFSVLAGSAITNTGPTVIYGDVGLSPTTGAAITGFPPGTVSGTIYAVDLFGPAGSVSNSSLLTLAKNDLTAAYLDAAGRPTTQTIPTELGGTTLGPGVYDSVAGTFGITGTLTLDGGGDPNAVFIFKMSTTLITETGSVVSLTNGAHVCNVYWQVGSSATIKTNSIFVGNVLALTSITVNTGATVDGRLLASNGAVTLDSNIVGKTVHLESIVLAPANSTNPLGDLHTVTATVAGTGDPVVGRNVTFTVVSGPNVNLTGVDITDINGQASFAYTSILPGNDTIEATFLDSTGANVTSNQVTKTWTGTPPIYLEGIVLAPANSTNLIGDLHTVTATVAGTEGPVVGRNVTFTIISGPNANLTGSDITGINGQASFTYTGLLPGTDVIVASFVNSTESIVTSNQVTETWIYESIRVGGGLVPNDKLSFALSQHKLFITLIVLLIVPLEFLLAKNRGKVQSFTPVSTS